MNSLILESAQLVGRAAVGSFGWQIGRDAHRNFLSILGYAALVLIGIGGIILPVMAARKIVQWHPRNRGSYFIGVFVPWMLLGALGVVLIIPLAFVFEQVTRIGYPNPLKEMVAVTTLLFAGAFTLSGTIWGLSERRERKRSYAVLQANGEFLSEHGLHEVDGAAVTHLDGQGRRLRLSHIGRDLIEFDVVGTRGGKAFISVHQDGRFLNYSALALLICLVGAAALSPTTAEAKPSPCAKELLRPDVQEAVAAVAASVEKSSVALNGAAVDFGSMSGPIEKVLWHHQLRERDIGADTVWIQELNHLRRPDTAYLQACFPTIAAAYRKADANYRHDEEVKAAQKADLHRVIQAQLDAKEQEERKKAEAKADYAADENTPEGSLGHSYEDYMEVRECGERRRGYVTGYVSDEEIVQARDAVAKIEAKIVASGDVDKNALWEQANGQRRHVIGNDIVRPDTFPLQRQACQESLQRLLNRLARLVPESSRMVKDF